MDKDKGTKKQVKFTYFIWIGTLVDCDKLCIYNLIYKTTTKNAQADTQKNKGINDCFRNPKKGFTFISHLKLYFTKWLILETIPF